MLDCGYTNYYVSLKDGRVIMHLKCVHNIMIATVQSVVFTYYSLFIINETFFLRTYFSYFVYNKNRDSNYAYNNSAVSKATG
jgi:hypothetical protein